MRHHSLSVQTKTIRNRSKTQRKVIKENQKLEFKQVEKRSYHNIAKKSQSTKNYLPKSKPQKYFKNSQVQQSRKSLPQGKDFKNERNMQKNDALQLNEANLLIFVPELPEKTLKVKKTERKKQQNNLNKLKQKVNQTLDIFFNKLETKINQNLKKEKNQRYFVEYPKKALESLNLQQTNFEEPSVFKEVNVKNINQNQRPYPSLKILKKLNGGENMKIPKRSRIKSCKFVVDPFKSIEKRSLKKFVHLTDSNRQNYSRYQSFIPEIKINEITEIEEILQMQGSQKDSMNISILDLMDW